VSLILESLQHLLSCFESQANDTLVNRQHAGTNNP